LEPELSETSMEVTRVVNLATLNVPGTVAELCMAENRRNFGVRGDLRN
jgi:hypothetical protein